MVFFTFSSVYFQNLKEEFISNIEHKKNNLSIIAYIDKFSLELSKIIPSDSDIKYLLKDTQYKCISYCISYDCKFSDDIVNLPSHSFYYILTDYFNDVELIPLDNYPDARDIYITFFDYYRYCILLVYF